MSACHTCHTWSEAEARQVWRCICHTTTPLGVWGWGGAGKSTKVRCGKRRRRNKGVPFAVPILVLTFQLRMEPRNNNTKAPHCVAADVAGGATAWAACCRRGRRPNCHSRRRGHMEPGCSDRARTHGRAGRRYCRYLDLSSIGCRAPASIRHHRDQAAGRPGRDCSIRHHPDRVNRISLRLYIFRQGPPAVRPYRGLRALPVQSYMPRFFECLQQL
jgi:hypothetical protein